MKTLSECPNCKQPIKSGFFGSNETTNFATTSFINEFNDKNCEAYCDKCKHPLINKATEQLKAKLTQSANALKGLIDYVPVITLQSPIGWNYTVIEMVTAQSVTGTGVISEITSSISDLFGTQSNRLNNKLKAGEEVCKAGLRFSATSKGANAIIATDIDYAEVGGDKGMLMVCMAGTAVRLANPEILGEHFADKFRELDEVCKSNFHYLKYANFIKQ